MNYGIGNVKAKIGGGDAELNLAYGLTPPNDTSKIWVKCDTPSAVKIEANRNLVISSNENAKKIETEAITKTYQHYYNAYYGYNHHCIKKNGKIYLVNGSNNGSSYFEGNSISQNFLYKVESDNTLKSIFTFTSANAVAIFDYDENHILVIAVAQQYFNAYLINCNDDTYERKSFTQNYIAQYFYCMTYYNNKVYGIYNSGSSIYFTIYDYLNNSYEQKIVALGYSSYSSAKPTPVYYNGYLYFVLLASDSQNATQYLARWEIGSESIEQLIQLPKFDYNNSSYAWVFYEPFIYGNKMIIGNIDYYNGTTPHDNHIFFIDLDNLTYDFITVGDAYNGAFMFLNENTGDIELWGGYPDATIGLQKRIIYNIYALEENTLDLFYDTYFTKNIRLIDSPTITIDAPINHAWLGDSNNIAQSVDMFYYENGLWYGVNCLGWTQLENATINASDKTIVAGAYNNQAIQLSLTWANESGQYSVNAVSSDETIATTELLYSSELGYGLRINGIAVGSATITISVVDAYGTTFTKTITATIEAGENTLA